MLYSTIIKTPTDVIFWVNDVHPTSAVPETCSIANNIHLSSILLRTPVRLQYSYVPLLNQPIIIYNHINHYKGKKIWCQWFRPWRGCCFEYFWSCWKKLLSEWHLLSLKCLINKRDQTKMARLVQGHSNSNNHSLKPWLTEKHLRTHKHQALRRLDYKSKRPHSWFCSVWVSAPTVGSDSCSWLIGMELHQS